MEAGREVVDTEEDRGQEGSVEEARREEVGCREASCQEVHRQEGRARDPEEEVTTMAGAVVLVLVLLAFPIVVGLSTAALAGLLGHFLWKDAEARHEGSELLDTNV